MGVGPAPWKLLRDQAAKDPRLLVASTGEGSRAQGAKGFCLTPKRQQKPSQTDG